MTSRSGRRGLALLLASGAASASVLMPATAYAEAITVTDPAGDPVRLSDNGSGDEELSPAPQAKVVDLVKTRFDYRNQVLVVRGTAVKASKAVGRVVRVKGGGQDQYFFAGVFGSGVQGDRGTCRGGTTTVNKETATYTVKIPARCFGSPERARVGLGLVRSDDFGSSASLDDGQRDGFDDTNGELTLSAAVKRG